MIRKHGNIQKGNLEAIKCQFKDLVSFVEDQSQQIELLMSTVQEQSRQIEELTEATKAKGQSEEMGARQKVKVNAQPQQRKELEQEKRKGKDLT